MGLVMRRNMEFGALGDVEGALRAEGVGLAPMSTGEASLVSGGVTVLATATAKDIADGRLKGLVVPGGAADEASFASVCSLIDLARAETLPIIAFADGVAMVAERLGLDVEGDAAIFRDGQAVVLTDRAGLAKAVAALS